MRELSGEELKEKTVEFKARIKVGSRQEGSPRHPPRSVPKGENDTHRVVYWCLPRYPLRSVPVHGDISTIQCTATLHSYTVLLTPIPRPMHVVLDPPLRLG